MRCAIAAVLAACACSTVACSPHASAPPAGADVEWRRALEAGIAAHRDGRTADAEAAFRAAIDSRAGKNADDPQRAVAQTNLAIVYIDAGRPAEAREPIAAAISAFRLHASESPAMSALLAQALASSGSVNLSVGDVAAAESDYRAAVSLVEARPDADASTVARSLTGVADALRQQGKLEDAESFYRRALPVAERAYTPPSSALGRLLNNYGQVLLLVGQASDAIPILKRAVATTSAALGAQDMAVGIELDNLAQAQMQVGADVAAEQSFTRALTILERALPPDHPELQACLNNFAVFLRLNNRPAEAKRLERRLTVEPPDST